MSDGNPRLRGDAATAGFVAAAAARSAAALVAENLADAPADPRLAEAARHVWTAERDEQAIRTHFPAERSMRYIPQWFCWYRMSGARGCSRTQ